ncbi:MULTISPECIES: hypothetical protein [Clostridium]|uniref:YhhN-like protein n=1 Tax=Clostridium ragsdalei P11 TaxID=1353534 RepID=A0A1A6AWC1_9CLOT|nr:MULTISPECIES: hypothetical protein [Clostridium]OBR94330.1 hypothetical protein CLRAG_14970 [Clostridium ragsdalei P11]QXE18415.1 hypothetical protein B5S50_05935 [Clostridium sp. 001]
MNEKNFNFNVKVLFFVAVLITAYFYIDKFQIIALVPLALCVYDGFCIFFKFKNRDGLRIIFFMATVLTLIFVLHVLVVYGVSNPIPIIIAFIVTNLFFIYNLIIYKYFKYNLLSLIIIILGWIICDCFPILMVFVLSAGLLNK